MNQMLAAIERRVCIRKFWRCNAGWGMSIILNRNADINREPAYTIYAYYDTLTACVRAEYTVWVKKQARPLRQDRRLKRAGGSR